jgi:CxxC motif-containing protein (DUF1111 family)
MQLPLFTVLLLIFFATNSMASTSPLQPTNNFSRAETGEHLPGGSATHEKIINKNAFSHASANMSFEREMDFKIGNGFFKRLWVTAPASTQAADGLGPLYNARSCQRCHIKDGRGHPPNGADDTAVSMFLRLSIPPQNEEQKQLLQEHRVNNIPDPNYGTQLQDFAIAGHMAEGQMRIDYEEISVQLADGEKVQLRKPSYRIESLGYGPLHPDIELSPRIAPQMIGLGLLEAIDEKAILQQADPDDSDSDGISGRANMVWSSQHKRVMLGRFGLKAGSASVNEQSQGAFHGDIGISVPLHQTGSGECTSAQKACIEAPDGNSPQYDFLEADDQVTDLVVFYAKNLAVPARRNHDTEIVLAGKKIFYEIGCIACHSPKYRTRKNGVAAEQADQLIWPYTDLLLHDMGEGLADHRPEGVANGREWRTPALWGIGLTPVVNDHSFYLHDGRARNLLEAILWHGGEAQASRDIVIGLSKQERQSLLHFIHSL